MRFSRIIFRLALALTLLLFGMPLAALDAPVAPGSQAGDAAGPTWFSSGRSTPAAPETGARKAPEAFAVAVPGGAAVIAGLEPEPVAARDGAVLGVRTPLYLSHCAFLC